jgi:hypothetical protein
MNVPKVIDYINFKVQLVTFRAVQFSMCTLVPTVLPTCGATLGMCPYAVQRSFVAVSISGIVSKGFPFIVNLISGNSQKSQRAKSGSMVNEDTGKFLSAKNGRMTREV